MLCSMKDMLWLCNPHLLVYHFFWGGIFKSQVSLECLVFEEHKEVWVLLSQSITRHQLRLLFILYIHELKDNIVKMAILPKLICRFHAVPTKTSVAFFFFCRNWQADLKIHKEMQGTHDSQNNLQKKKRKLKHSHFPIWKLYYKLE